MIIARGLGVPQFTDHASAVAYLKRLAAEPENRLLMRRTVAANSSRPGTASDDDVVHELGWRLVRGELQVLVLAHPISTLNPGTAGSSSSSSASDTAAAPASTATVGETAPAREQEADPEDASVLPEECDAAAQADTLAAAAETGAPLCEVCAAH
jgi:hypothetical protein